MGSIGTVSAMLTLDSAGYVRGAESASRAHRKMVREMEKTAGTSIAAMRKGVLREQSGLYSGAGMMFMDPAKSRADLRAMRQEAQQYAVGIRSVRSASGPEQELVGVRQMSSREAAEAMRQASSEGGNFLQTAIKVGAALKGAEFVIEASVAGAKLLNGEFKNTRDILEGFKGLPIVGGLIGAGLGAYDYATGKDLKDAAAEEEKRRLAMQAKRDQAFSGAGRSFAGTAMEARNAQALAGLEGPAREIAALDQERQREIAAVDQQVNELRVLGQIPKDVIKQAEDAKRAINTSIAAQQQRIRDDAARDQAKAQREAAEEQKKEQERQAREKLEIEQRYAKEVAGVRAENAAQQLSMQGRDLEAQILQIRESYRERIQEAQAAGQAELAALLNSQAEGALLGLVMNEMASRISQQALPAMDARTFGGMVTSGKQQREAAMENNRDTMQRQALLYLQQIAQKFNQNQVLVLGG